MYKIEVLPRAQQDLEDILHYISFVLKNRKAALDLLKKVDKELNIIKLFPYANSKYKTEYKLKNNYRRAVVNNYSILYTIDKKKKLITISRILYNKREIEKVLN